MSTVTFCALPLVDKNKKIGKFTVTEHNPTKATNKVSKSLSYMLLGLERHETRSKNNSPSKAEGPKQRGTVSVPPL